MSTMYGANVEQLRQCAQQFDQQARAVDSMARWLQQIPLDGWKGPDARQFHDEVQHTLVPHLTRVAVAVREAARDLRTQAEQQEQASTAGVGTAAGIPATGAGMGTSTGAGLSPAQQTDPSGWLRTLLTNGGNADTVTQVGMIATLDKVPKFLGPIGSFFSLTGALTSGLDIGSGLAEGDTGKVAGGVVDAGLVIAGAAVGSAGIPLVGGLILGKALVDASIPYSAESQDSLLDYQAQQLFHTPRSELTPEQAVALSNRYTGAGGVVNMVSDKMDQTADETIESMETAGRWFSRAMGME